METLDTLDYTRDEIDSLDAQLLPERQTLHGFTFISIYASNSSNAVNLAGALFGSGQFAYSNASQNIFIL